MQAQRLQSFLRESVRARSTVVACGPFECFFDPADPLVYLNYAVPGSAVPRSEAAAALPVLAALFIERARVPRFEFVASFAPELPGALEASGYRCEPGTFAMTCEPPDLLVPALDESAELVLHDEDTSDAEIAESLNVRDAAFGLSAPAPDADAVDSYRRTVHRGLRAIVRRDGAVVAAGSLTTAWAGVAEIAGIGVREDARRMGFGGAITAFLAEHAFASGIERLHLTAADARAASVYARVGFKPATHAVLSYVRNPA